jgi:hypothetical protein
VRTYRYVGPDAIRAAAVAAAPGTAIHSRAELERWLVANGADADGDTIPATYVVTEDGVLRIASRRSEHVACAAGQPVLAAGEIFFGRGRFFVCAVCDADLPADWNFQD